MSPANPWPRSTPPPTPGNAQESSSKESSHNPRQHVYTEARQQTVRVWANFGGEREQIEHSSKSARMCPGLSPEPRAPRGRLAPHLEPDHVGDLHPVEEALDLGDPAASGDRLEGEEALSPQARQATAAATGPRGRTWWGLVCRGRGLLANHRREQMPWA